MPVAALSSGEFDKLIKERGASAQVLDLNMSRIDVKVSDPSVTVGDWVSNNPGLKEAKVSSGLKYQPKRTTLDKVLHKPKKYAIRPNETLKNIAHRSYKDFALLREKLVLHFPGAFVPTIPKSKSKNAMGLFFEYVLSNPFFRNDVMVEIFLDEKVKNFSSQLKKVSKKSKSFGEGPSRWFQALSQYEYSLGFDVHENQVFFAKFKAELKTILKHLKHFHETMQHQMELQESQALLCSEISGVLQKFIAQETNLSALSSKSRFGSTEANAHSLKCITESSARSMFNQTTLLQKHYGSPLIQKKMLDPIEQQMDIANLWLKHLNTLEQKLRAFANVKYRLNAADCEAGQKPELERKKNGLLHVLFFYCHGFFGIELDMYRLYRGAKMKKILDNLSNFHLVGAERLFEIWDQDKDVVTPELDDEDYMESKYHKKKAYRKQCLKIKQNLNADQGFEPVVLQVRHVAGKKNAVGTFSRLKMLKVLPNEFLVGHRVPQRKSIWLAIKATGEKGYILDDLVDVVPNTEIVPVQNRSQNQGSFSSSITEDIKGSFSSNASKLSKRLSMKRANTLVSFSEEKPPEPLEKIEAPPSFESIEVDKKQDYVADLGPSDNIPTKISNVSSVLPEIPALEFEQQTITDRETKLEGTEEPNVNNMVQSFRASMSSIEDVVERVDEPKPEFKLVNSSSMSTDGSSITTTSNTNSPSGYTNFYSFLPQGISSFLGSYFSKPEQSNNNIVSKGIKPAEEEIIVNAPKVESRNPLPADTPAPVLPIKMEPFVAQAPPAPSPVKNETFKTASAENARPRAPPAFMAQLKSLDKSAILKSASGRPSPKAVVPSSPKPISFLDELKNASKNKQKHFQSVKRDITKFQKPAPMKKLPVEISMLEELRAKLQTIRKDTAEDDDE